MIRFNIPVQCCYVLALSILAKMYRFLNVLPKQNASQQFLPDPATSDFSLSSLKPLHAKWFLEAFDKVSCQKSVIMAGWEKTGIKRAIDNALGLNATSVIID